MGVEKRKSKPRRSLRLNPSLPLTSMFCLVGQGFLVGRNETPTSIMDLSLWACTDLSTLPTTSSRDDGSKLADADEVAKAIGAISNERALNNS